MESLKILKGKHIVNSDKNNIYRSGNLIIEGPNFIKKWKNEKNENFILFGNIFGQRNNLKTQNVDNYKIFEDHDNIKLIEGRFILIKIRSNDSIDIWTDFFGRKDIYWKKEKDYIMISDNLFPFFDNNIKSNSDLDQVGIAHSLSVYGSRPAKKHTKYKNINRLGVGEILKVDLNEVEIINQKFTPINSDNSYGKRELELYSDIFINSVESRSSSNGNIVFLSSGWDSTSILAVLVHLYGKNKTKCIIGRMKYSRTSGIINQFEIDKAKAITEYFGVKLFIVDLDQQNNGEQIFSEIKEIYKYNQFSHMTGINHWQLSKKAAEIAEGDESVFVGEMSDGAHNFGFSQYGSIFHPSSIEFREYSDKMASYLYGPTFLKTLIQGNQHLDPVWTIYKNINSSNSFEDLAKGQTQIIKQLLSSFFLRAGRVPLYSMDNDSFLTNYGKENYNSLSQKIYFKELLDQATPDNIYSQYLNLYNSFHWQGSTVATIEPMIEANGLTCALPFHDIHMIDFLSEMPESWGRGLDFNKTKYPLKWMLENKIDYPMKLQSGPHAYTYDVDPNFSLIGEVVYRSSYTTLFKNSLMNSSFINKLDNKWFDISYINKIISKYLTDKELSTKEMTDISVLSLHSMTDIDS